MAIDYDVLASVGGIPKTTGARTGRSRAARKRAERAAFDATTPVQVDRYQGKCAVPWCNGRQTAEIGLDPHELKRRGAGGRPGETNTIPLCRACHGRAHNGQLRVWGNPAEPRSMCYELRKPASGAIIRAVYAVGACSCGAEDPRGARFGAGHLPWCDRAA